jgi:hypothetical protein
MTEQAPPIEVSPPLPEPDPFWGYGDLAVLIGLTIPSLLLSLALVKGVFWVFHLHPALKTWELLAWQFALYGFLFGALAALFRTLYNRPFWRSLAWEPLGMDAARILLAGAATLLGVGVVGQLIHIPTIDSPLFELLKDRTSLILIGVFGTTIGPLSEELLFRGFLQPLFVRSMGPAFGILATALPFGLLHLQEYGNSWKHIVLISMAGAAFGWIRHVTGSTRASTLMHATYNGLQFALLLVAKAHGQI